MKEETALGAARARFIEGLTKKSSELRGAIAVVAGAPGSDRARDELRRKIHALHASALVFRVDELVRALDEAIAILDAHRRENRPIDDASLDRLVATAATVAALGTAAPPRVDEEPRATLPGVGTEKSSVHEHPTRPGTVAPSTLALGTLAPRPSHVAPRPKSVPPVDTVLSVMLVGPLATRLAATLPPDRFEVSLAEARDALVAARHGAPDVVVVGDDVVTSPGSDLVRALRGDPMTDLVPLLLVSTSADVDRSVARERGLDDVLQTTADARAFAEKIARLAGLLPSTRGAELGTITLRDAAERMADEIRRGLVDAADRGADELLSLGDGTELFAATWAAIARMRTAIADRAAGRVHFRDVERRGAPSWLEVSGHGAKESSATDVSLVGRRILVVDDDPAVRWFFVGLLEDAGAEVLEAPDGEAALELARRTPLDLVITDILMPKLDGLSLSRELSRDPTLTDVPVIFLSWKEDYLQRMRELRAGAAGYLRKEEGAGVILDRVRDAFRPRIRFETRLRDGGDVRGRVEGLGLASILRSVARIRKDARITVRDVTNLFEIDLRRGQIVELVRTASDGTFSRGRRALASLLGVTAGRFAVLAPVIGQRPGVEPIGPEVIEREAARLGALIDSVSGKGLALADRIEVDPDVVSSIVAVSPPAIVDVIRRLERNPSPRRWLLSGEVAPDVLGSALIELARRGALLSVRGETGEDRVIESLARRRGVAPHELDYGRTDPRAKALPESPEPTGTEAPPAETASLDEAEGVVAMDERDDDEPELDVGDAQALSSGELAAFDDRLVLSSPSAIRAAQQRGSASDDATVRVVRSQIDAIEKGSEEPRLAAWIVPVGLAIVLALVIGLVVLAMRDHDRETASNPTHPTEAAPTRAGGPSHPAPAPTSAINAAPARTLDPPVEEPMLYGTPFPATALGVTVGGGQGAIAVEAPNGATVSIDGSPPSPAPLARALDEGWHRVRVEVGDDTILRMLPVRAGHGRKLVIR